MMTYLNETYGDQFEIYRNIDSLQCIIKTNSVVGNLYFKSKQTYSQIKRSYLYLLEVRSIGVSAGRGGLACCNSWGHKESDTTE